MSSPPAGTVVTIDRLDGITVLTVGAEPHGTATFDALVSVPLVEALEALKHERSTDPAGRICFLQLDDGSVPPHLAEALYESLRGICGSVTLESEGTEARINLIRAASRDAAASTIAFLTGSPSGFVAGSTIDLTGGES
jgi:hypothetical protein